ncbi:ComF family protein [Lysinibacillus sp. LZ02]|uniref:ComF family protein n=1 Tax=Lysinibacillus sp. LZ02 TaxID=3420668 RepID=UPI003D36B537
MHKENLHCLLCGTLLTEQISWLTLIQTFPTTICAKCEGEFELYTNTEPDHRALYTYNEAMKDYLHRYKFMHDVVLAKVFQKQLHNILRNEKRMIVPIPMHPEKLVERTFSPIDELLIAAKLPYEHLLEKTTTTSQSTKSREERLNTPQLFRIKGHVKHTDYVIFDDIYTTGTTINHAKKVLLEAGAKSVTSVTLIRG